MMLTTVNFVTHGWKVNATTQLVNFVQQDLTNLVKRINMTDKKEFDELNETELNELKIEFAPGCFDQFEGTQEELDELISSIKEMFASGKAQELARPLDMEDLSDEDLELLEKFEEQESRVNGRTLQ